MSNSPMPDPAMDQRPKSGFGSLFLLYAMLFVIGLCSFYAFSWLKSMPLFSSFSLAFSRVLHLDANQKTWYITRSAGWISYLLVWLSVLWGLVLPTKFFSRWISPSFSFDFHEYLSLLALLFIAIHMFILLGDTYLPFNLTQIFLPFLSTYRPFWVGVGILAFYLLLIVTTTFYLRSRIGVKTFKAIHFLSFAAYLGATLHGIFSGTDSGLLSAAAIYYVSFLSVVFLTVFWWITSLQARHARQIQTVNMAAERF